MVKFLHTENGPAEGSTHQLKILFLNAVRSFVAKCFSNVALKSSFNRRHFKCIHLFIYFILSTFYSVNQTQ